MLMVYLLQKILLSNKSNNKTKIISAIIKAQLPQFSSKYFEDKTAICPLPHNAKRKIDNPTLPTKDKIFADIYLVNFISKF